MFLRLWILGIFVGSGVWFYGDVVIVELVLEFGFVVGFGFGYVYCEGDGGVIMVILFVILVVFLG